MAAATDKQLGELHSRLALQISKQLEQADQAEALLANRDDEDWQEKVVEFLEKCSNASPALLTIAAKFLKDNDITCQVEDSKEMTDLEKRLKAKPARKVVGNVLPIQQEDE